MYGHGGTNSLATTNGGEIRDLFPVHNWQRKQPVADPCLLDLDIVRHVFDEFVNSRLALFVCCQAGRMQQVDNRTLLQGCGVSDRPLQRNQALG